MSLSEAEKQAKKFFLKLICDGTKDSCEDMLNIDLPEWYDMKKFKLGQEFSQRNRFLLMQSIGTGLISIFSDTRSLKILDSTGRSNTPETAKPRYISTALHFLCWFESEMAPGSSIVKSLDTVRKAHVVNSKASKLKGIGSIKQFELVLTGFGFYGFPFLRPDLTGVRFESIEDRENFLHMWAILTRMVGVKDEYNPCLLPLNVFEMVGRMLIRYILIPSIQLELPLFKKMVKAIVEGMGEFNKAYDYDSQIFFTKMYIGVPGYQYSTNFDNEIMSKTKMLDDDDLKLLNSALELHMEDDFEPLTKHIPLYENDPNKAGAKKIARFINYEEEWHSTLGHKHFNNLSFYSKNIIRFKMLSISLYQFSLGKYILELLLNKNYDKMRAFNEENKKKKI